MAPPALRRAQIQTRRGEPVTKAERKLARTHAWRHDRTPEWRAFMELYRKFIHEWVLPQFGDGPLLYQRKPILRVVMPGSVAPVLQAEPRGQGEHSAAEARPVAPLKEPAWQGSGALLPSSQ